METRVYAIKETEDIHEISNENFMNQAEELGNVWSLSGFQNEMNREGTPSIKGMHEFSELHFRFIDVPTDSNNDDVYTLQCDEADTDGLKNKCFCDDCGEYVETSECTMNDYTENVDGIEVDVSEVLCNTCNENKDETPSMGKINDLLDKADTITKEVFSESYGGMVKSTIPVNCDEPKCTKCGSELEEEIWKTPTTDYEEYICSNEKCCAVHTINIDTELDDDGERTGDIERYWDTLDFSYIWEQGLKKDEPKDEILDKAKALIKAIDDNKWSLWENDIEIKHDCILWYEDNYQLNEDDVTGEWETEHKNGIQKAYKDLKNAMEERK